MDPNTMRKAKVELRQESFDEPHQVVVNPALSINQKIEVLDGLEQDARQLSVASAEGMTGGEPSELQEVLKARDSLEAAPIASADTVVPSGLRSRHKTDSPDQGGPEPKPDSRAEIEAAAILEQLGP